MAKRDIAAMVSFAVNYLEGYKKTFLRTTSADENDKAKAEYLLNLINKLNENQPRRIRLKEGNELNLYINIVYSVFDSAYFEHKNHPELSFDECFFKAEHRHRPDDYAGEYDWEHQEIKALAFQEYKRRTERGESGDAKSDWFKAKELYPYRKARKRIAQVCYNINENTRGGNQNFYWEQACKVMRFFEDKNIDYLASDLDLYDSQIFSILVDAINN